MTSLLEIKGDDIALLDDSDLRSLIGLLCEAEFRSASLPTRNIYWGGNQDAADGGLDVSVRSKKIPSHSGFIPRPVTGFQVKKPNMPKGKILSEMKPKGSLRDSIQEIIEARGSYIIVSSNTSTTESALKSRLAAMLNAIPESEREKIHLDFYDQGQVASWVRSHPSLILWVRNKIGKTIRGWKPYENWSGTPGGIDDEYLCDDRLRIYSGANSNTDGKSIFAALGEIRSSLSSMRSSVRLTGLSGVGKTRLAQALFDSRIGQHALNQSQVFYTDISNSPFPDPLSFAEQVISLRSKAILIVDNCSDELHRSLTQLCNAHDSALSLLTIEYDVRDHLPESTDAYRVEPASEDLIEKLIRSRFSHISQVDSKTIANHSGGNARVALALSNTLEKNETLSSIRDHELFERLFRQRNEHSDRLQISAEVCSLVYSFNGVDTESAESELKLLGSLINISSEDLYRDIKTLMDRDLVQSRDIWRAVLPHAIANWLAMRALESIPKTKIVNSFIYSGSERIIKSFSRRLGYLHDANAVEAIVKDWLSVDGWIGKDVDNLNSLGMSVFENIAPISPELTLSAMERADRINSGFSSKKNNHHSEFMKILKLLAYEDSLFLRCFRLLVKFTKHESEKNHSSSDIESLFYIKLSGTHASLETRKGAIKELVDSDSAESRLLGLSCLNAALTSSNFSTSHEFRFGSRSRDYGYYPRNHEDIRTWYKTFLDLAGSLSTSHSLLSEYTRGILEKQLRCLWNNVRLYEEIESLVKSIHIDYPWIDAWISIREIIRFDKNRFEKEVLDKLIRLEEFLSPTSLVENVKAFALTTDHNSYALDDSYITDGRDASSAFDKVSRKTYQLGAALVNDVESLSSLLPDLVSNYGARLSSLGKGIAYGAKNHSEVWKAIYEQFKKTQKEFRTINLIEGFFYELNKMNSALCSSLLDELVDDPVMGAWFPMLQTSLPLDPDAVRRLHHSLDLDLANFSDFIYLSYGRRHEQIGDDDLASLVSRLCAKDKTLGTPLQIVDMRFYSLSKKDKGISKNLCEVSQNLLENYPFLRETHSHNGDHNLTTIAKVVLDKDNGEKTAKRLLKNLVVAIDEGRVFEFDYRDLLYTIAQKQPLVFLNQFLLENNDRGFKGVRMFFDDMGGKENPVDAIPPNTLLDWCRSKGARGYLMVSSTICPFQTSDKEGHPKWKDIVLRILDSAPNLDEVLDAFRLSFRPKSGIGSLANTMENRLPLLEKLYDHKNIKIASWAKSEYVNLKVEISKMREFESARSREDNESFE